MSELVEKPQEGYQTPYQLILNLTADRVMSRINNENIIGINLGDRWIGLTERETDIDVPTEIQADTDKAHWKLNVTSESRGVVKTPVRFYTFTLGDYLKGVLGSAFKRYGNVSTLDTEGFYYTEEGEVIFASKSFPLTASGIKHSGIEFKASMYTLSSDGETAFIDMPVVKGELHILHIT